MEKDHERIYLEPPPGKCGYCGGSGVVCGGCGGKVHGEAPRGGGCSGNYQPVPCPDCEGAREVCPDCGRFTVCDRCWYGPDCEGESVGGEVLTEEEWEEEALALAEVDRPFGQGAKAFNNLRAHDRNLRRKLEEAEAERDRLREGKEMWQTGDGAVWELDDEEEAREHARWQGVEIHRVRVTVLETDDTP